MPVQKYQCKIIENNKLTPSVYELKFEPEESFDFDAGQFISITIPGAGPKGRDLRRAYSIASNPERKPLELCIKLVEGGPGTNYLCNLKPGESFEGRAPYGDFIYHPKPSRHACFISTGTGIAPFRAMFHSEKFKASPPLSTQCLFGAGEESELLYEKEIVQMGNVKWIPCISRDKNWDGFKGRVTDYIRQHMQDFPWLEAEFYLCGNGAMIKEMKEMLLEKGVEKASIHQEIYYRPKEEENS